MSNDNFYSIMCIAVVRKSAATATLESYILEPTGTRLIPVL